VQKQWPLVRRLPHEGQRGSFRTVSAPLAAPARIISHAAPAVEIDATD
jgi:hypothetical protein